MKILLGGMLTGYGYEVLVVFAEHPSGLDVSDLHYET
jgi:hypothetical protein